MRAFKTISDSDLLQKTEVLAREERRLHRELLEHLAEIDQRRLHLELGFSSLFAYVTQHLKYSEGAAQRRILAMQLMREVPEVAEKVASGTLSLSTAAQAQSVFREAAKTTAVAPAAKTEILRTLEGCSAREAERRLAGRFPEAAATQANRSAEKPRWLNGSQVRLAVTLTREQSELLEQMRARLGNPALTWAEAFEHAAKFYLAKSDPGREVRKRAQAPTPTSELPPQPEFITPDTRHISAPTRREVWRRDGARCTFVSPISGRVCGSTVGLELDHLHAWAHGGSNDAGNLALRCRAHNHHAAIKTFGKRAS